MKNNISTGILWQGFGYQWKSMPHRLSFLGSQFNNLVVKEKELSAYHDKFLKIGNFPKGEANYRVGYNVLQLEGLFFGTGRTAVLDIETPYQVAFEQNYEVRVQLKNLQASFPFQPATISQAPPNLQVVLNGFSISCQGNDSGWHFGGLGIELADAKWMSADTISFVVHTFCRPANSPEPMPHGNVERKTKRKWQNHHPCKYQLVVDYKVFVGNHDQLYIEQQTIEHEVNNRRRIDHEEELQFSFDPKKYNTAFPAITGFKFKLDAHRKTARKTGRYIRNLGVDVGKVSLDSKKGKLSCTGGFNFSNTILNKREFTAFPWNLEATLHVCQLAIKGKGNFQYNELTGRTSNSEDHVYSKRIICPL